MTRPTHIILAAAWIFFILRARTAFEHWLGYILGGLGITAAAYVAFDYSVLLDHVTPRSRERCSRSASAAC